MRVRRSRVSRKREAKPATDRSDIIVLAVRLALFLLLATMLTRALFAFVDGIFPRAESSPALWLLPGAILLAIAGTLAAAIRTWARIRRKLQR